jgi:hypothetical protein
VRKIVVFYAWQSDTPQRLNRYLIRLALGVAAKRLSQDADLNVEVLIDSDTQGVPGQPPVTETILKKIDACDVFAPDLSFVASTDGGKLIPNPNVMIEYGYALKAKAHAAMMPVMNTAFGPPESLPFDMGHLRHPLQYFVSPTAKNAERRAARGRLIDDIGNALKVILEAKVERARRDNPFPETRPTRPPAFFFHSGEVLATAGYPGEQEFYFTVGQAAYIRIFPSYADQPSVTRARLGQLFDTRKVFAMSGVIGGITGRNEHGPIVHDPIGESEIRGLTQGFETGELWGLNGQIFTDFALNDAIRGTSSLVKVIPLVTLERIYCRALRNYVEVLTNELNLRLPYTIELGIAGTSGVYVTVPVGGPFGRGELKGPVRKDVFTKRYCLRDTTKGSINQILAEFFSGVCDLVECERRHVLSSQIVAKFDLPPL